MRVDLNLDIDIYDVSANNKGEDTYKLKVHFSPIEFFMDFKFVLYHAHKGEYGLYPGSYRIRPNTPWVDKFEFTKKGSLFYLFMLDEVIDKVESYSDEIITRTHYDKHEAQSI